MSKLPKLKCFFAALSIGLSSGAIAHTVSIGYVPTSTFGTVNFFAGTYDHTSVQNEEVGRLVGVSNGYDSGFRPFNIPVVSVKPSGLVDGTNNFYFAPVTPGGDCRSGTTFPSPTYTCSNGPVTLWEGLQFAGLTAGSYQFSIANDARTTELFTLSGSGTVPLTLTASDISAAVPEPATLALFGLGFVGFLASRRKTVN